MKSKMTIAAMSMLVAGLTAGAATAQETALRLVAAWPKNIVFAREMLPYLDRVNERGKGKVRIDFIGAEEITPTSKQAEALRRGVFDVLYSTGTNHVGIVPEADAMRGGNLPPWEVRKRGGIDLLNQAWHKKLNAHVVGWFVSKVGNYIFLRNEPKFKSDGSLDLSSIKMRVAPTSQQFIAALGGSTVVMPTSDVYTALERGLVEGLVFPASIVSFGWEKLLKYRVEPEFLQLGIVLHFNLDKWNALPADARKLIQDEAEAFERVSYKVWEDLGKAEEKKLLESGMKFVELKGPARKAYLDTAYNDVWENLKRTAPDSADALKKAFFDPAAK